MKICATSTGRWRSAFQACVGIPRTMSRRTLPDRTRAGMPPSNSSGTTEPPWRLSGGRQKVRAPRVTSPSLWTYLEAAGLWSAKSFGDVRERLRAAKPEILAILIAPPLPMEVERRALLFRHQVEQSAGGPLPLLVLPEVDAGPRQCLSCGDSLPTGRYHRCPTCETAVYFALGIRSLR
jgi:hypothetical protein